MAMYVQIHLVVPFDLVKPTVGPLIGGQPNPLYPLALYMNDNTPKNQVPVTDGSKMDRYTLDGQTYHYHAQIDQREFDMNVVGLILQYGGEVYGYPLWAKVDSDEWDNVVADGTWAYTIVGEDKYLPTTVLVNDGKYPAVSQAIAAFGIENLVTQPQLLELIANAPAEQVEPE